MQEWAELYGWHAILTPELIVVAAVLSLLYVKAGNTQPNLDGVEMPLDRSRQASFYAGVICMYFGYGSALSLLAKHSVDAYVAQLCIRYLLMLPLLLAGTPLPIRKVLLTRYGNGMRHRPGSGLVAGLVFFLSVSLSFWPSVYQTVVEHLLLKILIHSIMLVSSILMWNYLLYSETSRHQHKRFRSKLVSLGCLILLPVCMIMMDSAYGVYYVPQFLTNMLCGPYFSVSSIPVYPRTDSPAYGGIILMASTYLSLLLASDIFYRRVSGLDVQITFINRT